MKWKMGMEGGGKREGGGGGGGNCEFIFFSKFVKSVE
jgi:hypothetical protein